MRKVSYIAVILLSLAVAAAGQKKTVEQLKSEAEKSSGSQRGLIYAQLAERLVYVADEQFTAGDSGKGQDTVKEIMADATNAHDAAVSSRKKLKEVEIHLRETQRHLENVRRTLAASDRPPLEAVEKKLAEFRQDLLNVMFAPTKDKKK
jgi:predicted RNA-binding Zn ribbon-like protein